MKPATHIVRKLLLGAWAVLALAPCGLAQTTTTSPWPGSVSPQTEFEQRSVKGWHARQTGSRLSQVRQSQLSEAPPWPAAATTAKPWTGTSGASMVLHASGTEAQLVAEGPDMPLEDVPLMPTPTQNGQSVFTPQQGMQAVPGPMMDGAYPGGEVVVDGGFDPAYVEGGVVGPPMAGPAPGVYGGWGPGAYWGPSPFRFLRNASIWAGVQGFKDPSDGGLNGNFGIHEGIDWGSPTGGPWGMGMQLGFQAVQSDFQGYYWDDAYESSGRTQSFFTAGLFRRNLCGGFQGGVAFDLMHDDYYYKADLKQVRLEFSAVWPNWREIGFWGAFGVGDEHVLINEGRHANNPLEFTLQPMDQFNFFYRQYFRRGGDGRVWVGFTSQNDLILGGDLWIPMGTHWAVQQSVNFLVPNENTANGLVEESWGISMQLVWYPGNTARASRNNPFRPLLRTADNATFMRHRQ